jgi:hypothetical protein
MKNSDKTQEERIYRSTELIFYSQIFLNNIIVMLQKRLCIIQGYDFGYISDIIICTNVLLNIIYITTVIINIGCQKKILTKFIFPCYIIMKYVIH